MNLSSNNWIKFYKVNSESKAVAPKRATTGSAAYDLMAQRYETFLNYNEECFVRFFTELAVVIPPGYVGDLRARSSLHKDGLYLANSAGVIDSDYRGEIIVVCNIPYSAYLNKIIIDKIIRKPIAQIFFTQVHTVEEELGSFEEFDVICKKEKEEGLDDRVGGFGSTDK